MTSKGTNGIAESVADDQPFVDSDTVDESPSDRYHPEFNDPDADLILVSPDGTRFRVHSVVLKHCSEFFKEMLTLPRAAGEIDVVPVQESREVLDLLLRLATGMEFFVPSTRPEEMLIDIALAATKYGMPGPISICKALLMPSSIKATPLQLYYLGCRANLSDVAKEGLGRTLGVDLLASEGEKWLEGLDGKAVTRLFKLRRVRLDIMRQWVSDVADAKGKSSPLCSGCGDRMERRSGDNVEDWRTLHQSVLRELEVSPSGSTFESGRFEQRPELTNLNLTLHCPRSVWSFGSPSKKKGQCTQSNTMLGNDQVLELLKKQVASLPTFI